jgi:hypothetical protein
MFFTVMRTLKLACLLAACSACDAEDLNNLRMKREELAAKKRPLIFANDGNDAFPRIDGGTRETVSELPVDVSVTKNIVSRLSGSDDAKDRLRLQFLSRRALQLPGTQVSTYAFNVITASFPVVKCLRSETAIPARARAEHLFTHGLCPLQMSIDLAREADIEIWLTVRMNEIHDGFGKSPDLDEINTVKSRHRDWLMQRADQEPKRHGWRAFNYEVPEVLELYFRFLQEMCSNYDIDGLDLDFMRFPILFRTVYLGQTATSDQIAILTDFMRKVRHMSELEGQKRGRPILINARVADSVTMNLANGIDIKTWLNENLIDTVTLGGRSMVSYYDESVGELKAYGKPIYVSLESPIGASKAGGNDGGTPPVRLRMTAEASRARAAEALHSGADGIYLLNFWLMQNYSHTLRQIGCKSTLVAADKDYFACWGLGESFGVSNAPFRRFETLCPAAPRQITPGESVEIRFPFYDDLSAARLSGKEPTLRLRLQLEGVTTPQALSLSVNGHALNLDKASITENWLEVPVPEDALIVGRNVFSAQSDTLPDAVLKDLILQVRYAGNDSTKAAP